MLVTTYVRTLPDVLGSLLRRMAPEVVDRVEFRGVFDVAKQVLRERGVASRLDGAGAKPRSRPTPTAPAPAVAVD